METQTTLPSGNNTVVETTKELTLNVTQLPTMEELERQYFDLVFKHTSGSKPKTAKILGVSVKTIYNKLDSYKIADEALRNSP